MRLHMAALMAIVKEVTSPLPSRTKQTCDQAHQESRFLAHISQLSRLDVPNWRRDFGAKQ
jgi:hypothetical protein